MFLRRKQTFCLDISAKAQDRPAYQDLFDFLVKDLNIPPDEILEITSHHKMDSMMVKVEKEDEFQKVLGKLKNGVLWEILGRKVYGWPCDKAVTRVKVINWSMDLPMEELRDSLSKYGQVVDLQLGYHPMMPGSNRKISNGTVTARIQIEEGVKIPNVLNLETLGEFLQLFSTACDKACYKCGDMGHMAASCEQREPVSWKSGLGGGVAPPVETVDATMEDKEEDKEQGADSESQDQAPKRTLEEELDEIRSEMIAIAEPLMEKYGRRFDFNNVSELWLLNERTKVIPGNDYQKDKETWTKVSDLLEKMNETERRWALPKNKKRRTRNRKKVYVPSDF